MQKKLIACALLFSVYITATDRSNKPNPSVDVSEVDLLRDEVGKRQMEIKRLRDKIAQVDKELAELRGVASVAQSRE